MAAAGFKCADKGELYTPDLHIVSILTQNCMRDFQGPDADAVLMPWLQLSAHASQRSPYENETKALTGVNPDTKILSAALVLAHDVQLAFSHRSHYRNNKKNQNLSHMQKMMNDGNTTMKAEGLSLASFSAFWAEVGTNILFSERLLKFQSSSWERTGSSLSVCLKPQDWISQNVARTDFTIYLISCLHIYIKVVKHLFELNELFCTRENIKI